MKKILATMLSAVMLMGSVSSFSVNAEDTASVGAPTAFDNESALYAHALVNSADSDAWVAWQCEHDEDFNIVNSSTKYFFLPSSADDTKVDIYNAYSSPVTVNGVSIDSGETKTVSYTTDENYSVKADNKTYTLKFMKSNAESSIYINNSDADGNGTDLMSYLNETKSNSAKATGAIVDADGKIDNTPIKKIKGRGNTTWDKPKKAYNITYDGKVSIGGMAKSKKYSILANYQDDSLSRNRFLYDLSDAVGMPYASDSRYVDFYVNGFYWGSYQMTEKVEAGSSYLINDVEEDDYLNEDGTIKEDFSFVCEIDASATEGEDYYFKASNGNKITIKVPELEEGDVGYEEVKDYVKSKFDLFNNKVKTKTSELSAVADIESLTKLYLINELGKNWDSGVSSIFFTYKPDENGTYKFYGSPVWDYDNSLGNAKGVSDELYNIGVKDYKEYSGWWCKYKGKSTGKKSTNNVINNISRHNEIAKVAPQIWFEEFVPAINHFTGAKPNSEIDKDFYTSENYFNLLKDSAEMNYKSGWLLNTGSWIADHSKLYKATYDEATQKCVVDTTVTKYASNFEGAYNYASDWMTSRAAWISEQFAPDYVPSVKLGDVNGDGIVSIIDSTEIQKYLAEITTLTDTQLKAGDVNGDGIVSVMDATDIQKYLSELITEF